MKRALVMVVLAVCAALLWMPALCYPAALWNVTLTNTYGSDQPLSLVGQFATASADIDRGVGAPILSFTGLLNGQAFALVPVGADRAFAYDNLFYGPTDVAAGWSTVDAFDSGGVVITTGASTLNVYSESLLIGLYMTGYGELVSGDISYAGSTSAVLEPGTRLLMFMGACVLFAWVVIRKHWRTPQ